LHSNHNGERRGFSRFIEVHGLRDSIVFNDEILRMQAVNGVAGRVAHEGWNTDQISVRRERWFLLSSCEADTYGCYD